MALLVNLQWLVDEGIYPTVPAARMGIYRGELPPDAIVRRSRRVLIRPDVIKRWIEAGAPKPERPDPRKRWR